MPKDMLCENMRRMFCAKWQTHHYKYQFTNTSVGVKIWKIFPKIVSFDDEKIKHLWCAMQPPTRVLCKEKSFRLREKHISNLINFRIDVNLGASRKKFEVKIYAFSLKYNKIYQF